MSPTELAGGGPVVQHRRCHQPVHEPCFAVRTHIVHDHCRISWSDWKMCVCVCVCEGEEVGQQTFLSLTHSLFLSLYLSLRARSAACISACLQCTLLYSTLLTGLRRRAGMFPNNTKSTVRCRPAKRCYTARYPTTTTTASLVPAGNSPPMYPLCDGESAGCKPPVKERNDQASA